MNTQKLLEFIPSYLDYLSDIGYSKFIIDTNISVTNRFKIYCLNNDFKNIDLEVIKNFCTDILKIDGLKGSYKYVVKRSIIGLFDYSKNGKIELTYKNPKSEKLKNSTFENLLNNYINNFLIKQDITKNTKKGKIRVIIRFLNYLTDNNIIDVSFLTEQTIMNYLYFIKNKYKKETFQNYIRIIKEFTKFLYQNNLNKCYLIKDITIVNKERKPSPEYFKKQELQQILNSIDIDKQNGKFHYLIILLLITYGLRIKDVINLKFENIDFEKNTINIIQTKTKKELSLFLTVQVKFAILDYIKNERTKDIDSQYIFITIHRPYRPYAFSRADFYLIIKNLIYKSKVNIENKTLGSRIFRHSLATNMINENISLNDIQAILGHSTSKTTAVYITRDTNNLKLLTLKVPYNE